MRRNLKKLEVKKERKLVRIKDEFEENTENVFCKYKKKKMFALNKRGR